MDKLFDYIQFELELISCKSTSHWWSEIGLKICRLNEYTLFAESKKFYWYSFGLINVCILSVKQKIGYMEWLAFVILIFIGLTISRSSWLHSAMFVVRSIGFVTRPIWIEHSTAADDSDDSEQDDDHSRGADPANVCPRITCQLTTLIRTPPHQ